MIVFYLLIPSMLMLISVFGLPLMRYAWLSFHADSVLTGLQPIANGGANWIRLMNDYRYWQDLIQTMRFAIASVGIELVLGVVIALLLNQPMRKRGVIRSLSLIPWALPTTVMALGWRWIFNTPYGPFDQITSTLSGVSLNILGNPSIAWIGLVYADVWKTTPFVALIVLAGLQSIPGDLYEACTLEGGSSWTCFRRITLPLLKPYLGLAAMFRLAQAFGVFDLVQVMTGGGPASSTESIALYAYWNALRFLDFGYSATIMIASFILLSTIVGFSWWLILLLNQRRALTVTE